MPKNQKQNFLDFIPAQLSKGKEWVVYYYVVNPYSESDKLVRKRKKCNFIKSLAERKKYADRLVREINAKLYAGWNPFTESEAPKSFNEIGDCLNLYLKSKIREKLSPDTIRTYKSKIKSLLEWLEENGKESEFVLNFTKSDALAYMNYLFDEKGVKNITFNKTLKWCRSLFNWLIENEYAKENHFATIKTKQSEEKERLVIPRIDREKIRMYFEENDSNYFLICLLVFGSLLRPKEITFLKPGFFDLKNQIIKLPAYATKNNKSRIATIPDATIHYFTDFFSQNNIPGDWFLFDYHCNPSPKQTNAKYYSRHWSKLRKELGFPMEYKLYGLRDSGIIDLLQNGVSPEEVMKLADHSSLEITSIYVKQANPMGSTQVKRRSNGF